MRLAQELRGAGDVVVASDELSRLRRRAGAALLIVPSSLAYASHRVGNPESCHDGQAN
jgi:hypothetical protein